MKLTKHQVQEIKEQSKASWETSYNSFKPTSGASLMTAESNMSAMNQIVELCDGYLKLLEVEEWAKNETDYYWEKAASHVLEIINGAPDDKA